MMILDTNIISEMSGPRPFPAVLVWASTIPFDEMYLCAPVIAEMSFSAERQAIRTGSPRHLDNFEYMVIMRFAGRILPLNATSARIAGKFRAIRERAGRPVTAMDMAVAGIAAANGATLATRNVRDFEGLDLRLVNPFEA